MRGAIVELSDVSKDYGGLRPLRIGRLALDATAQLAILGVDQPAAEVLINLLTGTTLPDRGDVRVFGRSTGLIADGSDWLAGLDAFGIVSDRAPLLDALSVLQNLAMPISLDVDPLPADLGHRAARLAGEVGLGDAVVDRPLGELDGTARARVRVARALALNPRFMLLEHPTFAVPRTEVVALGRDLQEVFRRRAIAALTLTADEEFAVAVSPRVVRLDAVTGRLTHRRSGRWFTRR